MSRSVPFILLAASLLAAYWLLSPPGPPTLPPGAATQRDGSDVATARTSAQSGAATADAQRPDANVRVAATPAVDRAPAAGLLRVTATWGAAPAPDVLLTLRWATREHANRVLTQARTDPQGRATFVDVPIGRWSLRSDRGDRSALDVEAGEQDVAFALDRGVSVQGSVVGPDEAPVAGAAVWLQTRYTDWTGGRELTVTDSTGVFRLDHVPAHVSLGAFAAGFGPSPLVDLDTVDTDTQPVSVTLQLVAAGGDLEGRVLDSLGRPVEGARVGVGTKPRFLDYRGERAIEQWSVRSTLTDERGRYRLPGLRAGAAPIACMKEGFGIGRATCEVREGDLVEQDIRLARAATIHGAVTRGDGEPFAGALVRVYDSEPGLSFLAGGQIDWDEMFGHFATVADDTGRYELKGITPGTVHAFVQPGGRFLADGPVVHARAVLEVPSGARVEWSPTVSEGRTLEGVVYYRDGRPMPNVFLTLTDENDGKQHVQTNDRDGAFRFVNLDDTSYSVRVQMWDAPDGAPPLQATGLRPGQGRVELRATHDKPIEQAPGAVLGRVDDAGLRIRNPKAVRVMLASDERWFRDGEELVDGAFRFDRVKPCRFRLALLEDDAVLAHSDWFELLPGAQLDVGVLRTVAGGSVKVTAVRGPGTEAATPKLYLRHASAPRSTQVSLTSDEVLVESLTPGSYEVTGFFKGICRIQEAVEVVAGQTTPLTITLTAGVLTKLDAWLPVGAAVTSYDYEVRTEAGELFHAYEGKFGGAPRQPFPVRVTMPPGRYSVVFRAGEDLLGRASFTVSTEPASAAVRVDVRAR